jgi:AraC family transcriptional regulator of adaptative response/methylated-DNA-[protein]-cysteine methyltransferase
VDLVKLKGMQPKGERAVSGADRACEVDSLRRGVAVGTGAGRASRQGGLVAEEVATPLRPMLAVASARGICLLEFVDRPALATAVRRLRARPALPVAPGPRHHLARLRAELDAYFAGTLERFGVPLDPDGTPFQRRVWDRLRRVPFGATISYSRIATEVEAPRAVRAVGRANGQNPIAIVIPCHRVVGTGGALCGYGGGLWRKRWLLEHERRHRRDRDGARRIPRKT